MRKLLLCIAMLLALSGAAGAEELLITAEIPVSTGTVEIQSTVLDGENWLFLPAHAKRDECDLHLPEGWMLDGEPVEDEGYWIATLVQGEEDFAELYIMQSENLRTLYLFSDDPINEGREWIDGAPKHETRTTGRMMLVDAYGTVSHQDQLTQLRGRGNSTWLLPKKAYQIKLENKADLLQTGDPTERNRTWVLLADGYDATLLHNRISLDLGREMGLGQTPFCEHVDLYYDGAYRGTYLLSEKVEVNEGRVEILDYDKLLDDWNKHMGLKKPELQETATTLNRFGNEVVYAQNVVADDDLSAGGYMIEMESVDTLSDRCWFRLSDGKEYAFKSPENPNLEMVLYASELLQEGFTAAQNGGVNPDTGKSIADYFDLDSYARLALITELSGSIDAFRYSSTFFILPEGQTRFECGPVWDLDLAWRDRRDGSIDNGKGLAYPDGWLKALYSCEAFQQAMRNHVATLEHCVRDVLLGTEHGQYLKPLTEYSQEIDASRRMNDRLWGMMQDRRLVYGTDVTHDEILLREFIQARIGWLVDTLDRWQRKDTLALTFDPVYANVETTQRIEPSDPWMHVEIQQFATEQITEADEEAYALWQTDVVMQAEMADGMKLTVNGTEIPWERQEDGLIAFSFLFEDSTYRPVDFDGEDLGWIFDAEYYAKHYPDVAEECENDPYALMEWFYYDGMFLGHQGCKPFSAKEVSLWLRGYGDLYEEDWAMYYPDYSGGMAAEWMAAMLRRFQPTVHAIQ